MVNRNGMNVSPLNSLTVKNFFVNEVIFILTCLQQEQIIMTRRNRLQFKRNSNFSEFPQKFI